MGKETDIWDDSALLKAFDKAIAKYKKMHSKTDGGSPTKEEEVKEEEEKQSMNVTKENDPTLTKRNMEINDKINDLSNSATETCISSYIAGGTSELQPNQSNQLGAKSSASKPNKHSSSGPAVQETFEGYTELQGAEYNQLLSQYYELEEQRQKVLHQLGHASSWNYQSFTEGSGSCLPWNVCCAASQEQLPMHHASHPGHFSYCTICSCHCLAAPCPSMPTCSMGGQCFSENGAHAAACKSESMRPSTYADSSIIKAAKEAAEKAISSMKLDTSMTSNICEENGTEKKETSGTSDGGISQNIGSETDVTVVLNSWFSAGFYTGKYLLEQSLTKSRH